MRSGATYDQQSGIVRGTGMNTRDLRRMIKLSEAEPDDEYEDEDDITAALYLFQDIMLMTALILDQKFVDQTDLQDLRMLHDRMAEFVDSYEIPDRPDVEVDVDPVAWLEADPTVLDGTVLDGILGEF